MIEQTLEQLFNSEAKIRLIKFFIRNKGSFFTIKEIAKILKQNPKFLRAKINQLQKINFVLEKLIKKRKAFSVNQNFIIFQEVQKLVLKTSPASKEKIKNHLKKIKEIKLVVLSGIFENLSINRIDLLLVGKNISEKKLKNFIENLEAEIGQQIKYSLMTTQEFNYRRNMYDRFLREILESRHEKLINKLKCKK